MPLDRPDLPDNELDLAIKEIKKCAEQVIRVNYSDGSLAYIIKLGIEVKLDSRIIDAEISRLQEIKSGFDSSSKNIQELIDTQFKIKKQLESISQTVTLT